MKEQPLTEFLEHYENAVEELCAANGFGRKHGQPRRAAQGACRALMARATTAEENLESLFDYLNLLLKLPVDAPVERESLPPCKVMRMFDFFRRYHEVWSFSAEVFGMLYAILLSLSCFSNHLTDLKDSFAPKYTVEKLLSVCLLREDRQEKPSQEECDNDEELAQLKSQEEQMYQDCIFKITGPQIYNGNTWNAEIESIVEVANDCYKEKGLPDFMVEFLEKLKVSSESARQQNALFVREHCDRLRDDMLLDAVDAIFGELASRSIAELLEDGEAAQEEMMMIWNRFDSQRLVHEKRLTPDLANPNAEDKLLELVKGETSRYKEGRKVNKKCRTSTAQRLREQADHFVKATTSYFAALIALIDAIPLHAHFSALPGDESVEPPRMSIKRRMRYLQKDKLEIDQSGEALPPRDWPGIPQYGLQKVLARGKWPPDERLAELDHEALNANVATLQTKDPGLRKDIISSFRSPVHKKLVERRDFHYARFEKAFLDEAKRRDTEFTLRENQDVVGRRNWKNMVRQLKSGEAEGLGIDDDDDDDNEEEEENAEAQ
jgi:hypothetical protein